MALLPAAESICITLKLVDPDWLIVLTVLFGFWGLEDPSGQDGIQDAMAATHKLLRLKTCKLLELTRLYTYLDV